MSSFCFASIVFPIGARGALPMSHGLEVFPLPHAQSRVCIYPMVSMSNLKHSILCSYIVGVGRESGRRWVAG